MLLTFENIEQWLPEYKNVTIEELPYCNMPIERALEVVRDRKAQLSTDQLHRTLALVYMNAPTRSSAGGNL